MRQMWGHVTVVTGPVGAGKSTWIREHAAADDIVIDFDLICRALGSPMAERDPVTGKWEHPSQQQFVAYRVWLTARMTACDFQRHPVWLIQSQPSSKDLAMYQARRATVLVIDPDTHQPKEAAR